MRFGIIGWLSTMPTQAMFRLTRQQLGCLYNLCRVANKRSLSIEPLAFSVALLQRASAQVKQQCSAINTWIILDAVGGSPGSTAWPVRRWTSSVSGAITISGRLAKALELRQGLTGYIIVKGTEVYSQFIV